MTITIEGELALIRKNKAPAAPANPLAELSAAYQSALKPAEAPNSPAEAAPPPPAPTPAGTPGLTDAAPADAAAAPSGLPAEDEPFWEPTEPLPGNDAGTWDVAVAAWTRDTITTDAWNYAANRRRALTLEVYQSLPPEAQKKVLAPQQGHRSQWKNFEQLVMREAGLVAASDPTALGNLPLSVEQMDARLNGEDKAVLADAEAVLNQPGGALAEFMASAGRSLTKPESLALMPFGFGSGSLAKFVASEAVLSGAASAMALPGQFEAAKRLDLPDPDPVAQIATDAVIGGGFAGILAGVAKGFQWAAGRERAVIEALPDGENPVTFGAAVDRAEAELTGDKTVQEATGEPFDWSAHRSDGGLRDDAISGMKPQLRTGLEGLIAAAPPSIRKGLSVFSGYRSTERQRELYEASDKSGHMVARPGHSQHEHGNAADLKWNGQRLDAAPPEVRDWIHANAERFGLTFPLAHEPWHIEAIGARGGKGAAQPLNLPPGTAPYNEVAVVRGIIGVESGGRATAQNPNSSARGLGQITAETWLALVRTHRPDLMEGRTANQVLALRDDAGLNTYMTAMNTRDNHAALTAAGVSTNPGDLYLAHFMGPGGAIKALRAAPDTPVTQLMSPSAIKANADIRFGGKSFADFTAGDLRRWSARKMRGASGAPAPGGDMPTFTDTTRGYTGSGQVAAGDDMRIDVDYEVVDYASLIRAAGDLQPRDRSRINSDDWIAATAARLDPAQLMPSPNAATGTPIVGPDNMIESGNGRVSAIGRAYERAPDRAQAYRGAIEAAGYQIPEGVTQPVLVARRRSALTPAERRRFVVEAQDSGVAQMTPTEVARATARNLDAGVLAKLDPTAPIASGANGDFIRAALSTLPRSARNAMFEADGALNANGQRQLREALFARAWPDPDILARYTEGTDRELKSLMEALETAAPNWAALRADIEAGLVDPAMDISAYVLDAMRLIGNARDLSAKQGLSIARAVAQLLDEVDLLEGAISPLTTALVRKFWANGRAAPADQVATFLARYADEARLAGRAGGMFDTPGPRDVLRTVDPQAFRDLPEDLGRARGFATPTAPRAAMPEDAFTQGASSPEAEAVQLEAVAAIRADGDSGLGPVIEGYTNDPEGAIARLMADKTGEVRDAFQRPDVPISNITLVYGTEAFGLRHIEMRHPEMIVRLPDILQNGRVVTDPQGQKRLYLVDDARPANVAVLRLEWDGVSKTWLMTAFEDNRGAFARQGRTTDGSPASASPMVPDATGRGQDNPDAPADQGPGLTQSPSPELDQAAIDAFDAGAAIAAARAEGTFEIKMPDGTTYSAAEVLDDLDQDARADFQITFCTTNDGSPA